jgi:hypothetical protein
MTIKGYNRVRTRGRGQGCHSCSPHVARSGPIVIVNEVPVVTKLAFVKKHVKMPKCTPLGFP